VRNCDDAGQQPELLVLILTSFLSPCFISRFQRVLDPLKAGTRQTLVDGQPPRSLALAAANSSSLSTPAVCSCANCWSAPSGRFRLPGAQAPVAAAQLAAASPRSAAVVCLLLRHLLHLRLLVAAACCPAYFCCWRWCTAPAVPATTAVVAATPINPSSHSPHSILLLFCLSSGGALRADGGHFGRFSSTTSCGIRSNISRRASASSMACLVLIAHRFSINSSPPRGCWQAPPRSRRCRSG